MGKVIAMCLQWGYGRIFTRVGGNFRVALDLRWKMSPRLDSGMISGVGLWPSGSRRTQQKVYSGINGIGSLPTTADYGI